jgi:hypothetical protein
MKIPTNHEWKRLMNIAKKTYIPWWEVFIAVDISKTMLIKDVDWETCQWIPVPCGFSGRTLLTNIVKTKSRFKIKFYIPPNINYKVPHWSVVKKIRWVEAATLLLGTYKLLVGL